MNRIFYLSLLLLFCFSKISASEWRATQSGIIPNSHADLSLKQASSIDIDFDDNIFIIDSGADLLLKFDSGGNLIKSIGGFGNAAEQFDSPRDVDAGATLDIFVADFNNSRVLRYDKDLNFLNELSSVWPEPYNFERVLSVAISSQRDLFVLEDGQKRIIKFSRFAEPAESFAGIYETYGQLLEPQQICLDGNRYLFASDPAQEAVVIYDYLGNYISMLQHPEMEAPGGLHWGADNLLYVVDQATGRLFLFDSHLKYSGMISLNLSENALIDVAVHVKERQNGKKLYALTESNCKIFQLIERE